MRITLTIPHERDLGCGCVSFESVTATAEVDLSSESVTFLSVESDGRPLSTWEREDIVAPLGALREALLDLATEIRSDLAKATAAESAERSVA